MGGFQHRSKVYETFLDPLVLLAYVLGEFDDIDLGTSILVVPYRNAFALAKGIATLTHLSRKDVAVGIAHLPPLFFHAPGEVRRPRPVVGAVRGYVLV